MKRKIFIWLFLILILISNLSFASYSTVTMSVVEEPVCTIEMGENSKFEKKLIQKDLNNKEVTLQLQVTNEEVLEKANGEIMLVLDTSESMNEEVSTGKTRKEAVFESAKVLVNKLLQGNDQLDIGIVSFSSNSDVSKEGTLEDATVVSTLSKDASALSSAISQISATGERTALQAGLILANQQFTSKENNKYIIVLTDGIPNISIDFGGNYYSDNVFNNTKQQLQTLGNNGINIITMLTGITDVNTSPSPDLTSKTKAQIIEEVFGTQATPTVGDFYYIQDNQIEETITANIYNSLVPVQKSLKDITIVDYFPQEIIDNFDFAYVTDTNIGEISAEIDTSNNSITWEIPELASGQTATVQYKLKLKENYSVTILEKVLNTNEKVDADYTDLDDQKQTKTSNVSPKIKLSEPEPSITQKEAPKEPKELPKAGSLTLISFVIVSIGILVFSMIRLIIINKKMK